MVRQVETATSFVRDRAVKPLRRIAAFLGLGVALLLLGGAALVFLVVGGFRLLQRVPPEWPVEPYLILGVPLVLLGIVAWLRRKPRSNGRGGDKS